MNDRKALTTAGIHPWTVNQDLIQENKNTTPGTTTDGLSNEPMDIGPENTDLRSETENETESELRNQPTEGTTQYLCRCDVCGRYTFFCVTESCISCEETFDLCARCYSLYYSFCPVGYGCSRNPRSLNNY